MNNRNTTATSDAQALLETLKIGFLDAMPERCNDQELLVLALEDNCNQKETFDELYRNVHSVKGSAGTHGIPIVSSICHYFEDHLERLNNDFSRVDKKFVNQCFSYLDLIRKAVMEATASKPDFTAIEKELNVIANVPLTISQSVVIAESSMSMALAYKNVVSDLPLEITLVNDGLEALSILLKTKFDILIVGRSLKTLNGLALINALRVSDSNNTHINTIMLTSASSFQFPENAYLPEYVIPRDSQLSEKLPATVLKIIESKKSFD